MSVGWLALVDHRDTLRCECHKCVVAGCTRPAIHLKRTRKHPARWLHGTELIAFYADEDAADARRDSIFESLKRDLAAQGIGAQRGDEPRTKGDHANGKLL